MSRAEDAETTASAQNPVRVLIVEDSGVVRAFLRNYIEADPEMKVTGTASNGQLGLNALKTAQFDVVVLDIEMPVMDGLTALPLILQADPNLQVIIASTLTKENAVITMKCLQMGAAECLAKPTAQEMAGSDAFRRSLVEKVKTLGLVTRRRRARNPRPAPAPVAKPVSAPVSAPAVAAPAILSEPIRPVGLPKTITLRSEMVRLAPDVIAIGSSTGGPQALLQFFSDLKAPLRQPVLVTQHMPPTFTTILAEQISKQSGLTCKEAAEGDVVTGGVIYIAPGNYHMTVKADGMKRVIALNQEPPENFCRPSVDPMLRSIVNVYGRKVLMVMFTGMGADGTPGCRAVVEAGGTVIAQDEATSVVWGMPGSVALSGLCTRVLPLGAMAREVRDYADRLVRA